MDITESFSGERAHDVHGFFRRSGASITSFRLSLLPFTAELVAGFLTHVPKLTKLSFRGVGGESHEMTCTRHLLRSLFIDPLSNGPGSSLFLPRLVELETTMEREVTSTHEDFATAVRSR